MCGPSSQMKQINQSIQAFGNKVTDEAGTIFGAANTVFNTITNGVKNIIARGESAMGFGAGELAAKNAAAVQAGAAYARNVKGAAASATGAIGGGNVVMPAGATQATVMSADQAAAAATAGELNKIQTEGFERGNQDFWKALTAEKEAPGAFSVVNEANKTAMEGQKQQLSSQQSLDTASNWWQPLLEQGAMSLVGSFTGGLGTGLAKKALGGGGGAASSAASSAGGGWSDLGDVIDMQQRGGN